MLEEESVRHLTARSVLRGMCFSLMSSSGMVEILRLEAKLSLRNGRLILVRLSFGSERSRP